MGMARDTRERLTAKRRRLNELIEEGEVSRADGEAIKELVAAYDAEDASAELPDAAEMYRDKRKQSHSKPGTLACWIERLTRMARIHELTGPDRTASDWNKLMTQFRNGEHPAVKDDGLAVTTCRNFQFALCKFYRYHGAETIAMVDPNKITVYDLPDDSGVNPRDMLDAEEIDAMRNAAEHPRDRAIISLLIYTGMRNTALRHIRIKDIDLEEGQFYFNTNTDGLKDIYKPQQPRPLLQAEQPVREWLNYHPAPDDGDAYLITAKPKWCRCDPHKPVTRETIRYTLKQLKEKANDKGANITKPVKPHSMRHNYVTICKRSYELPDDTVKYLIGHYPDSTVMQTTYAHLKDKDHIQRAEVGAGMRDETDIDSPFTPKACDICGTPADEGDRACSTCGHSFTPDAYQTQQAIDDTLHDSAVDAETEEEKEGVSAAREIIQNNPELKEELIDELKGDVIDELQGDD